jgi:hypothetical protein
LGKVKIHVVRNLALLNLFNRLLINLWFKRFFSPSLFNLWRNLVRRLVRSQLTLFNRFARTPVRSL